MTKAEIEADKQLKKKDAKDKKKKMCG